MDSVTDFCSRPNISQVDPNGTMSDCTNYRGLRDTKRSGKQQSCSSHPSQIVGNSHAGKRMKPIAKKINSRVTFAEEDVYINGYTPYEAGITDAEVIRLYRSDIWYTRTDYNSFMQDRIDTIRVYRSVNGNMSGLQDYYSTHGLEHFLAVGWPIKDEEKITRSNISGKYNLSSSLLTANNARRVKNATATFPKSNESGVLENMIQKGPATITEGSMLYASSEKSILNIDHTKRVNPLGNAAVPTTMGKNVYSVDVKSLRQMNIEFLKGMTANAELRTNSVHPAKANTGPLLSHSLLNSSYCHESIPTAASFNTLLDFKNLRNADYNANVISVMNQALEITSACVEHMNSSMPVIELQDMGTSGGTGD